MNPLDALMQRSQHGDGAATAELRQKLRPELPRVVRRGIARSRTRSTLARLVRKAAEETAAEPTARQPEAAEFAERVAERLCDILLRSTGRAQTWCAGSHDTVLLPPVAGR